MKPQVNFTESFALLDIRVGTVISAITFVKARNPSYKIEVDFGPAIGIKKSSAQITHHYEPSSLIDTQIIAVINFPPKNIAGYISEFLILGIYDNGGEVILLRPDRTVDNGSEIG